MTTESTPSTCSKSISRKGPKKLKLSDRPTPISPSAASPGTPTARNKVYQSLQRCVPLRPHLHRHGRRLLPTLEPRLNGRHLPTQLHPRPGLPRRPDQHHLRRISLRRRFSDHVLRMEQSQKQLPSFRRYRRPSAQRGQKPELTRTDQTWQKEPAYQFLRDFCILEQISGAYPRLGQ